MAPAKNLFQTVIWAVDAFADRDIQLKSLGLIRALANQQAPFIKPVYVLTPDQVNVAPEFFVEWTGRYVPAAEQALRDLVEKSGIGGMLEPKVLTTPATRKREAIALLLKEATESRASLIVATTTAKRGIERLMLGSFAETLLLASPIPVLLCNPTAATPERIQSILFATDFSDQSRRAFNDVVTLAECHGAKIGLYYHCALPDNAMLPVIPDYERYVVREKEQATETAQEWAASARRQGVEVKPLIDARPGTPGDGIAAAASSGNYSMIAMATMAGPVASVLIGSTARQVVREATCPVWIVRKE